MGAGGDLRSLLAQHSCAEHEHPVLILHGDADDNTYPANSREMYQALRHLGRTVQYVRYPREGHGVAEPNHKKDEYRRRILEWLDRYVVGEAPVPEGSVAQDGHSLTVAAMAGVERYSGRKPKGRFVELALALTPADGLKLDISRVRLLTEQAGLPWEVGVAGVAAGGLLIPAAGAVEQTAGLFCVKKGYYGKKVELN